MPIVSLSEKAMILDVGLPQGGWIGVTYALWFPVTAGNELAQPALNSAWKDISAKDPGLLSALRAGQIIERIYNHDFPSTFALANVEAFMQAAWNAVNAYLTGAPQPGQFYGTVWDGTAWAKA